MKTKRAIDTARRRVSPTTVIAMPTTKTAQLLRRHAEATETSLNELARRLGVQRSSLTFLFKGHSNTGRFLGLKPAHHGEDPLLVRVVRELEIPGREVMNALALDLGFTEAELGR